MQPKGIRAKIAPMPLIAVFCGSQLGNDPQFAQAAEQLAEAMTRRGLGLVYGGGNVGLMGHLADAMLQRGGEVIGVIPQSLLERELGHQGLSRLEITNSMHERKARMAELSDAFIAIPGGYGTLDEWFEILTWRQLGIHDKPVGLLNCAAFFTPMLQFIGHLEACALISRHHRNLFQTHEDPSELLSLLLPANLS